MRLSGWLDAGPATKATLVESLVRFAPWNANWCLPGRIHTLPEMTFDETSLVLFHFLGSSHG